MARWQSSKTTKLILDNCKILFFRMYRNMWQVMTSTCTRGRQEGGDVMSAVTSVGFILTNDKINLTVWLKLNLWQMHMNVSISLYLKCPHFALMTSFSWAAWTQQVIVKPTHVTPAWSDSVHKTSSCQRLMVFFSLEVPPWMLNVSEVRWLQRTVQDSQDSSVFSGLEQLCQSFEVFGFIYPAAVWIFSTKIKPAGGACLWRMEWCFSCQGGVRSDGVVWYGPRLESSSSMFHWCIETLWYW